MRMAWMRACVGKQGADGVSERAPRLLVRRSEYRYMTNAPLGSLNSVGGVATSVHAGPTPAGVPCPRTTPHPRPELT